MQDRPLLFDATPVLHSPSLSLGRPSFDGQGLSEVGIQFQCLPRRVERSIEVTLIAALPSEIRGKDGHKRLRFDRSMHFGKAVPGDTPTTTGVKPPLHNRVQHPPGRPFRFRLRCRSSIESC
jgi:hypothetical protein